MWTEVVAAFLAVSIVFYSILAGADFGAGMLELFVGPKKREEQLEIMGHAIAPVWEANHMWIVLGVVILFMGFPAAYSQLSITYHVPLTIMLLGIVLRGCAFTFRHYDAVKDGAQRYYTGLFIASSYLAPLMLGMIAGGVSAGRVPPPLRTYGDLYLFPWLNLFSAAIGVFVCALFAFVAAVYLVGETDDAEIRNLFRLRARIVSFMALLSGGAVFVIAESEGLRLASRFFSDPISITCMALATLLWITLWFVMDRAGRWAPRIAVAAQVTLIVGAWLKLQYPALIASADPAYAITLHQAAAPEATLRQLGYALFAGSALIFPSLYFLFRVFKKS